MAVALERLVLQCFSPEGYAAIVAKPVGEFSLVEALCATHDELSLGQIVQATPEYPCMQVVDVTPLTTGKITDVATCVVIPPSASTDVTSDSDSAAATRESAGRTDAPCDADVIVVQLHAGLQGGDCLADRRTATEALLLSGCEGLFTVASNVTATTFLVRVLEDEEERAESRGASGLPPASDATNAATTGCAYRLLVGDALFRNLRRVVCQMPSSIATVSPVCGGAMETLTYSDETLVIAIDAVAPVDDGAGNLVSYTDWQNSSLCLNALQLAPALDDFFLTNVLGEGYFDLFSAALALVGDQLDGRVVSQGDILFARLRHGDVSNTSPSAGPARADGVDILEIVSAGVHHGIDKWDGLWVAQSALSPQHMVLPLRVVSLSRQPPNNATFGVVSITNGATAVALVAPIPASKSLDGTPIYAPMRSLRGAPGRGGFPSLETLSTLDKALSLVLRPTSQCDRLNVLVVHGIKENWPYDIVERAVEHFGLRCLCVSVDAVDTAELETVMDRFLTGASSHHAVLVLKNAQNMLPEKRHLLSRFDAPRGELSSAASTQGCSLPRMPRLVVLVCESLEAVPPSIAARATNTEGVIECGNPSEADRARIIDWVLCTAVSRYDLHRSMLLSVTTLAAWTVGLPAEEIVAYMQECISSALALLPHANSTSGRFCAQHTDGRACPATQGQLPTVRGVLSDTLCEDVLQQFLKSHGHNLVSTKLQPVRWSDVGGLEDAKRELRETIQLPMLHPELFANGMKKRTGILFYGPPGCGKTLLAKAVATEMNMNFMSVKGPELINQYVGESERNIRLLFQKARDNSPCIVFFDELDALVPARGAKGDAGGAMDRIVSQLLVEVDGVGQKRSDGTASGDVFIIGATNRPDLLDPSLLRPGRFDRLCYLGMPSTKEEQLYAVKALTRKFDLGADVDLSALIEPLDVIYTGADFFALCSDAMMFAVEESLEELQRDLATALSAQTGNSDVTNDGEINEQTYEEEREENAPKSIEVTMQHFLRARDQLKPSVSKEDLLRYESLRAKFSSA